MATKRRLIQSLLVVMLLLSACAAPASTQKNAPGAAAKAQPSVSAKELPPADTGVAAALTRFVHLS